MAKHSALIVLNTRPKNQSHAQTAALAAIGAQTIALPLINIEPISFLKPKNKPEISIFLSANAVDSFFDQASGVGEHLIAIGPATAQALKDRGYEHSLCPLHFSSEGLLEMPELQNCEGKRIDLISGENSKARLSDTLKLRGAIVQPILCYRRKLMSYDADTLALVLPCTHIIVTSSEIFQALLDLFQTQSTWLMTRTLCVISDDMRKQAEDFGFQGIIQADNATTKAIIEAFNDNKRRKT